MPNIIGVKAVHDSDLRELLTSLGILEGLVAGKFRCTVCGCLVDIDNLGSIFPHGNDICVSCDNNRCISIVTSNALETRND